MDGSKPPYGYRFSVEGHSPYPIGPVPGKIPGPDWDVSQVVHMIYQGVAVGLFKVSGVVVCKCQHPHQSSLCSCLHKVVVSNTIIRCCMNTSRGTLFK